MVEAVSKSDKVLGSCVVESVMLPKQICHDFAPVNVVLIWESKWRASSGEIGPSSDSALGSRFPIAGPPLRPWVLSMPPMPAPAPPGAPALASAASTAFRGKHITRSRSGGLNLGPAAGHATLFFCRDMGSFRKLGVPFKGSFKGSLTGSIRVL